MTNETMKDGERAALKRAMDLLDTKLGDTDPNIEGMTQDEVDTTYPVLAAMQILSDLYCATERMSDAARDAEDAVRYRWLRERHWNESTLFVVAGHHSLVRLGTDCPSDERLDAAIDAEIERIDRAEGNRSPIDGNRSMISVPASHVICEVAGVTIIGSPDNVAAARAALEAAPLPAYPEELTPELREVLGWPNFKCAPVAHAFQASGYPIAKRAEDEQAFVLHWFTKLVLRHGGQWWEKACEEIASLAESARTRRAEAPNAD